MLGAEYVENAFKTADDFSMPMQELTTEYCWGYVWGREGLDKKTRSMLNLAMISCSTGRTSCGCTSPARCGTA